MARFNFSVKLDNNNLTGAIADPLENALRQSVQTSLSIIRDRWQREAQNRLKSTRADYLMGLSFNSIIYPLDSDGFVGSVQLDGKLPNMIEEGFKPFDMKIGFGKSNKVSRTKGGGWYLTVPFRHSTPNSNGSFGAPMPKSVYNVAKKLAPNARMSVKGGNRTSWTGYQHKNNIYDGLTRIVKSYKNTNQSQYYTFRRVSNNSDPMSWQHPGWSGLKVAEKLMPFARQTFIDTLTHNLSAIF